MSRYPSVTIVLAAVTTVVLAVGLTACDDGSSNDASRPNRSTTTSTTRATTTTSGGAGGSTTTSSTSTTTPVDHGTCGNQTDAIVAAIEGSDVGGLDQRAGQFTVQGCRIAASSPIWAAADAVPNPGIQLDRSSVLLQRIGALWNVMTVGTEGVGCDAPAEVRTELRLSCAG